MDIKQQNMTEKITKPLVLFCNVQSNTTILLCDVFTCEQLCLCQAVVPPVNYLAPSHQQVEQYLHLCPQMEVYSSVEVHSEK